ncbi:MAG TPA: DUF1800 domain-containing protein [Thermomicrobiaceae bacterium]|nr:DUF1800 domain-containing protein [Thermomicrobiaceae bacterium]
MTADFLHQRLNRRAMVAGVAAAGLGAALAAYHFESPARSAPLSDQALYGHLLRRAGFGLAPGELGQWEQLGWDAAVDRLVNYQAIPNDALEARLTSLKLDPTKAVDIMRWWTVRMVETARPLEEKMTLFWHGLLTSALTKARPAELLVQNQFLRANALSDYGTILKGITRDPAMMLWLDTATNKKGHANENYARELMELFTMGPGHYSETDVRESARAFTGLVLRRQNKDGVGTISAFLPAQHDNGIKNFLGQTGNFGPDDIIDIILQQQATPQFLAHKLLVFFLTPTPSQPTVDTIAGVLKQNNYSIKEAVRAIFLLPEFRANAAYRASIKSPAEYSAGMLRGLGVKAEGPYVPYAQTRMGQELFNPPNVAGWPGGTSWLNSGTWLTRLNLGNYVTASRKPVPLAPQTVFNGQPPATPRDFVDRLAAQLLDDNVADSQRQLLYDYAGSSTTYSASFPAWFDQNGRSLIYLMLALPEYHLN